MPECGDLIDNLYCPDCVKTARYKPYVPPGPLTITASCIFGLVMLFVLTFGLIGFLGWVADGIAKVFVDL